MRRPYSRPARRSRRTGRPRAARPAPAADQLPVLGRPDRDVHLRAARGTTVPPGRPGWRGPAAPGRGPRSSSAHGTRVVIRAAWSGSGGQSRSRSAYGDSRPRLDHRLVQRDHPVAMEGEGVVELERLPRRAQLGIGVRVGRGVEGRDADLVAHDVVRMRVAAVLVVGGHDVRPERADDLDQRRRRLLQIHQREAALGQRRQRVTLRQPGVDEAEPDLLDAEDLPGPVHLLPADPADVGQHVRPVHGRVEDRPPLARRCRWRPAPRRPRRRTWPSSPRPCSTRRPDGRARAAAAGARPRRSTRSGGWDMPVIVPRGAHGVRGPADG